MTIMGDFLNRISSRIANDEDEELNISTTQLEYAYGQLRKQANTAYFL